MKGLLMEKYELAKRFEERIMFMQKQYKEYYNKGDVSRMSHINFEINQLRKIISQLNGGDAD
jgi:hypothetical protein